MSARPPRTKYLRFIVLSLALLCSSPAYAQWEGWIDVYLSPTSFAGPNDTIGVDYLVQPQCPWEDWDRVVVDYVEWDGNVVGYSEEGFFYDNTTKDKVDRDYDLLAHCYCTDWWGMFYSDEFEVYGGATAQFTNPTSYVEYGGVEVDLYIRYNIGDPQALCTLSGGTVGYILVPLFVQTFIGYDAWDEPGDGTYYEDYVDFWTGWCNCNGMGPPDANGYGDGGEFNDDHLWAFWDCCYRCDCEGSMASSWTGYSCGEVFTALEQSWTETCYDFFVTDMSLYIK